jgi:catechol 2,3-dioxygenase-like lactoylglutathione lyase family enzyme
MLDSAHIVAIVPVSNIETAIEFYEGKLGLRLDRRGDALPQNGEAELSAGSGSLLLYESVGAGKSRHTIETEGGIATVGEARAASCKDPDGNILAVESAGR